jgi:hypothetical protein
MVLAILCFVISFLAAQRSLMLGLSAVLTAGYAYGIARANIPGAGTYLMFDCAVAGLYVSQFFRGVSPADRVRLNELWMWTLALIAWPAVLFAIFLLFPAREPLVEMVGLRANVFLLPFLFLGGRLTGKDIVRLAIYVAVLNLAVVGIAAAEFSLGLERFYPRNEATEIIYRSNDLLGYTAYRIPATFVNAHAFAGTMATSLVFLLGAWSQPHTRRWVAPLLATAAIASFIGIFMAAARTHMITAAVLALIVTTTGGLSRGQWLKWLAALAIVGYVVAADARLQRFSTLAEEGVLTQRIGGSVNVGFLDVATAHPFGNGLTSGGTSVPYFLLNGRPAPGMLLENEYARIAAEQGLPGLALWILFIVWVATRLPGRIRDSWLLGRRAAWAACLALFASAMLGIGMLASVPQTALMLLLIGWFTVPPAPEQAEEHVDTHASEPLIVSRIPAVRTAAARRQWRQRRQGIAGDPESLRL